MYKLELEEGADGQLWKLKFRNASSIEAKWRLVPGGVQGAVRHQQQGQQQQQQQPPMQFAQPAPAIRARLLAAEESIAKARQSSDEAKESIAKAGQSRCEVPHHQPPARISVGSHVPPNVVALVGPQETGKSTFCNAVIEEVSWCTAMGFTERSC